MKRRLLPLAVVVAVALLGGCGTDARVAALTPPLAASPSPAAATASATPSETASPTSSASATSPPEGFHISDRTSAGPILQTTLSGPKSGVTGKVWVWLPPEYNDPAYARTNFPVLMLYTGNTGVDHNFWDDERVEPIQADDVSLTRAGRAHPFIMVMPVLQLSTRMDTECSDVTGEPRMGTWLADDVPDMVRANFRTLPDRDGWGMAGASSGGFCAAKLLLLHPDRFRAAVSWCGYFSPEPEAGPAWSSDELRDNSPTELLTRDHPDVRLFLMSGDNPRYSSDYERIRAFAKLVTPPTEVTTYFQPGGGHFTSDLAKLIPQILEFLTANLDGPSAG